VHDLFGTITEQVLRAGGDVLYHAGDAVGALFPAPTDGDRDAACRRAVRAALDAHARIESSATAAGVGVRAAVGCGETRVWEVGGADGAWSSWSRARRSPTTPASIAWPRAAT
jgi:class 3 adenylate cyclase